MNPETFLSGIDQLSWQGLGIEQRIGHLRTLRRIIGNRSLEIAAAISKECRRPIEESLSQEVLPALEMIRYLIRKYPAWLNPRPTRYLRPGFFRKRNYIIRQPLGTVVVICPANFPFSLAIMSLSYLMLAGNTVVLKPSERSETVAPIIKDILEKAGLSPHFARLIEGGPKVAEQLIVRPEIKKVFFYGSRQAGKSVEELCRESSTPCVLEMGGGVTAIVLRDADIPLAASGVAWGGMYAGGRSCLSVDRAFVDGKVYPHFLSALTSAVAAYQEPDKPGERASPDDHDRLKALVDDAVSRGARTEGASIVADVPPDSTIMQEEVFGPLIAVCPFDGTEQSVGLVNRTYQAAGVSIWTKDQKAALSIAPHINVGMMWVNDCSFGLPTLPWGGWHESGKGTIFSEHALHEVLNQKWISCHPGFLSRQRFWWRPYSDFKKKLLAWVAKHLL
jgi:acyl-CoA reductase-like NAD-dependent aldehyde dehydrogenase